MFSLCTPLLSPNSNSGVSHNSTVDYTVKYSPSSTANAVPSIQKALFPFSPCGKIVPLQDPTLPSLPLGLLKRLPRALYSDLYLTLKLIRLSPLRMHSGWNQQPWSSFSTCHPPQYPAFQQYKPRVFAPDTVLNSSYTFTHFTLTTTLGIIYYGQHITPTLWRVYYSYSTERREEKHSLPLSLNVLSVDHIRTLYQPESNQKRKTTQ